MDGWMERQEKVMSEGGGELYFGTVGTMSPKLTKTVMRSGTAKGVQLRCTNVSCH